MAENHVIALDGGDKRLTHLIEMTTKIISSHASNSVVVSDDIPDLIGRVFAALDSLRLGGGVAPRAEAPFRGGQVANDSAQTPAVPIAESITPDALICLEDGKRVKLLHRYIKNHFGITPSDYRRKWKLPSSYPMVAPAYSESRRAHAARVGFKKRDAVIAVVTPEVAKVDLSKAVAKVRKTRRIVEKPAAVIAPSLKPKRAKAAAIPPVRGSHIERRPKESPVTEPVKRPRRRLGIVTKQA